MQFLGTGGFLMRRGDDVLMTPPLYSNPSFLHVLPFIPMRADTAEIDGRLPDTHDVSVILVGHAHYDHLLDVPHIATNHATNAVIYGSTTTSNILRAILPPARLQAVDARPGAFTPGGKPGEWFPSETNRIRFMPLKSMHSPHIGCITFFSGNVTPDNKRLPRFAWGWKGGPTLAYIIDFLGPGNEIEYRILYTDSAVHCRDFGGLPAGENRLPDVTVVCLGGADNARDYPEKLFTNAKPGHVIVAHWENFFKRQSEQEDCYETVPRTDAAAFLQRLHGAVGKKNTTLPLPGAWMRFTRTPQL